MPAFETKGKTKGAYRGKRVGVLMGGLSEEREISLKTGGAVLKALLGLGYDAVAIDAGRDLPASVARERIEAAFIALHGRYGEDGCVQGLLEVMGIPYTGSGVRASAIAMDKVAAKKCLLFHRVSTPPFAVIDKAGRGAGGVELPPMPVVVKPSRQGSAIGVNIVRKASELKAAVEDAGRFPGLVLVEKYINGRELTVSILDGRALPVIEIRPGEEFYNYRAKYTKGVTDFIVPAELSAASEKRVVKEAVTAYEAIGCEGAARVDVMLDKLGKPYVLEVNTVPGLTELSLFPRAAEKAGLSYAALVEAMLDGASLDKA